MTLDELIAKLEAATGPDRELDQYIFHFLNLCPKLPDGTCEDYRAPHYTDSLDAAMQLVPEGWLWQVSNRAPEPHAGRAFINNGEMVYSGIAIKRNPKYQYQECTAATPAIALCIACLKARQSGLLQEG